MSLYADGGRVAPAPVTTEDLDGLAVRVRRPADPEAVAVFVHGAMDRAASFARVMRRLPTFMGVAYDRRGYAGSLGAASGVPGASGATDALEGHATDLVEVLQWATREAPAVPTVVVGHSLGGLIGLLAAAEQSRSGVANGRTSSPLDVLCTFEAPLPFTDPGSRTSGSLTIRLAESEGAPAAAEFFLRSMIGDAAWDRMRQHDRELRRAEGAALVAELRSGRAPRTEIPLPAPGCTLCIGVAEHGPEHLHRAAQLLADAAGVGVYEIAGAGHGAHLSNPDEFARWVHDSTLDGCGERAGTGRPRERP